MNPLRMYGNTVEIHRYQITYLMDGNTVTEYAHTEEEAKAIAARHNTAYLPIDTSDIEWMDGLTFDSRDEALSWIGKGEAAYLEEQNKPSTEENVEDLKAKISALTTSNQMLEDCLVEMAGIVYA